MPYFLPKCEAFKLFLEELGYCWREVISFMMSPLLPYEEGERMITLLPKDLSIFSMASGSKRT
jgi:hypothetical protein